MPDVNEILKGARDTMSVRRVYGDPVEKDGLTVIPVASVMGGGGGGGDEQDNGGAGFGLFTRPVGAYVIRDGGVTWSPADDRTLTTLGWQLVSGLFLLVLWGVLRGRAR